MSVMSGKTNKNKLSSTTSWLTLSFRSQLVKEHRGGVVKHVDFQGFLVVVLFYQIWLNCGTKVGGGCLHFESKDLRHSWSIWLAIGTSRDMAVALLLFAFESNHMDVVFRLNTHLRKIETVLDLNILRYRIDYLRGNLFTLWKELRSIY